MKLLFSADEHLVLRRKGVPKEWEIERFKLYHKRIQEIIQKENVQVLVHGGDFFDREPNYEEIVLAFREHFNCLRIPTYVIDGNHEAKRKGTTFLSDLKALCTNTFVTFVDDYAHHAGLDFIPYCKLKEFASNPINPIGNILITHVRGDIEPHVKAEIDLRLFDKWKLVLAGDLHDRSNSQRNIMYPGSPMTTHAYRDPSVKKGVLLVDTETLECKFIDLNLPKLLRKTVTSPSQAIKDPIDHIDYEIVLPELVEEYQVDLSAPEFAVRVEKDRVTALAEVLEGNVIKEAVLRYYVDLKTNKNS